MRILYVEDNQANLLLVQRLARLGNHEVIGHPDGETVLARFEQDKPDLILMDVQLSGAMTGLEVVKALRARGHKTPIIALTAYAMVGDRERCLEAGCDGYLPKPLPIEELVEMFERYTPKPAADRPAPVSDGKPKPDASIPLAQESTAIPAADVKPVATPVAQFNQPTPESEPASAAKPVTTPVTPVSQTESTKTAAETDSKNI